MDRLLLILLLFLGPAPRAQAIDATFEPSGWQKLLGDHFVVLYPDSSDEENAHDVLDHAEDYYHTIADDIGYTRYQNFWTWNNRVKIIMFDTREAYVQQTGQPPWSGGFARPFSEAYRSRIIVSYKDQANFMDVILPHEITHLVLHDFIGFDRPIPRFFDEGVAQLEQKDDSLNHMDVMARLITQGRIIPLPELLAYDFQTHKNDARSMGIFYIESLYIVDFLVKTYGKDAFQDLCRRLRDGEAFEAALKSSYYPTIDSMQTLQEKWVDYAKEFI